MTIKRFEEIEAWQLARKLVKSIYLASSSTPMSKDYRFCSQLQAAAVSIMSNIAEGFSSQTRKEFIHFLTISLKSAAEVQSLFYVGLDVGYLTQNEFTTLFDQVTLTAQKTNAFRAYLKRLPPKPLNRSTT